MIHLEPFGERIIIRQNRVEQIGSIIVPESTKDKSIVGVVVAVGPEAVWTKVGETVLFGHHAGFKLPTDLEGYRDCRLMNEEDLLAKISSNGGGHGE